MSNFSFEISHFTGKTTRILSVIKGLFMSSHYFDLKFRLNTLKRYIMNMPRTFLWNNYVWSNFRFVIRHMTGKCLRSFANFSRSLIFLLTWIIPATLYFYLRLCWRPLIDPSHPPVHKTRPHCERIPRVLLVMSGFLSQRKKVVHSQARSGWVMFPDLIYYDTDLGFALADCQQTVMWATHNTPWFDQL